mmetsp:Transcript_5293/g.22437  ORF Transcript_5293/g.22437 Transcript_5293/m.22437 type:complete len:456 (+) Transcript_5293:141-1508(+)
MCVVRDPDAGRPVPRLRRPVPPGRRVYRRNDASVGAARKRHASRGRVARRAPLASRHRVASPARRERVASRAFSGLLRLDGSGGRRRAGNSADALPRDRSRHGAFRRRDQGGVPDARLPRALFRDCRDVRRARRQGGRASSRPRRLRRRARRVLGRVARRVRRRARRVGAGRRRARCRGRAKEFVFDDGRRDRRRHNNGFGRSAARRRIGARRRLLRRRRIFVDASKAKEIQTLSARVAPASLGSGRAVVVGGVRVFGSVRGRRRERAALHGRARGRGGHRPRPGGFQKVQRVPVTRGARGGRVRRRARVHLHRADGATQRARAFETLRQLADARWRVLRHAQDGRLIVAPEQRLLHGLKRSVIKHQRRGAKLSQRARRFGVHVRAELAFNAGHARVAPADFARLQDIREVLQNHLQKNAESVSGGDDDGGGDAVVYLHRKSLRRRALRVARLFG